MNWRISTGSKSSGFSCMAITDPQMEVSGRRSSWLTIPRNSARSRSISSSCVMSCMVTTTDSTSPASDRTGVTLTSTLTLLPSGTARTISSARTVSVMLRVSAKGNSGREISLPSARRTVSKSSSCSAVWSGSSRPSTILLASRLKETGAPLRYVEDGDPHGGSVDEGFQAGLGALLLPVPAGIGDHQGDLGGEHDQGLLILLGELAAVLLLGQVDIAHAPAAVAYGYAQEGAHGHRSVQFAEAHGLGMAAKVRHPDRAGDRVQMYSKNRWPSGMSQMRRASSTLSPETRRSSSPPASSRVVMTP